MLVARAPRSRISSAALMIIRSRVEAVGAIGYALCHRPGWGASSASDGGRIRDETVSFTAAADARIGSHDQRAMSTASTFTFSAHEIRDRTGT